MYAQIVSKNLISILSYQSFICCRYFQKSTIISLKHNSPIHNFQKLFPFAGSTQRSKGKKQKFPFFIQSNIWAYCDEIALDWNFSFNMWWQPFKRGFNVNWYIYQHIDTKYRYKLLYDKDYCDKFLGFPTKMTTKRHSICKV